MTLTVPQSNARPGRAPQIRVEADQTGASIAQLGQVMNQVGTRIVEDRLTRATARAETDFARDIGQLRLEFDQMTDPDAIDAQWGPRVAELKAKYAGDQDPRVKDRLEIGFDRLANSHANQLGARAVALGQEQREADWIQYRHDTLNQAATVDPDTRNELIVTGLGKIDALVADGTIAADEGARRKVALIGDADSASATSLIASDPAAFLNAADQGIYDGLGAETLATRKVQAQARLDAIAAEDAAFVAKAERERTAEIGDFLTDARDIFETGRPFSGVDRMDDPEVRAHEKFAEAAAARDLALETPNFHLMTAAELRMMLEVERQRSAEKPYQLEREKVLREALAEAEAGWKTDQVGYANSRDNVLSFPELPQFDPNDPTAYAKGIKARLRHSAYLNESGYVSDLDVLDQSQKIEMSKRTGPSASPEERAALAVALQAGLAEAPELVETMTDDPVFLHVSRQMTSGLNPSLAQDIFRGQQSIAQGNVSLPPARTRQSTAFDQIADIYADIPGGEALQAQAVAAADALYAVRMARIDPGSEIDDAVYRQALHDAHGGTGRYDKSREARGGVQDVNGAMTLLPADVAANEVETAIDHINYAYQRSLSRNATAPDGTAPTDVASVAKSLQAAAVSGGAPDMGDPGAAFERFNQSRMIKLPGADDLYVMQYSDQGGSYFIEDTSGGTFVFRLRDLIKQVRQ